MTEARDTPQRRTPEQEPEDGPPDGLSFHPRTLPAATAPSFDPSFFDGLPLDEDGVPVLPAEVDRRQLPGFEDDEERSGNGTD